VAWRRALGGRATGAACVSRTGTSRRRRRYYGRRFGLTGLWDIGTTSRDTRSDWYTGGLRRLGLSLLVHLLALEGCWAGNARAGLACREFLVHGAWDRDRAGYLPPDGLVSGLGPASAGWRLPGRHGRLCPPFKVTVLGG